MLITVVFIFQVQTDVCIIGKNVYCLHNDLSQKQNW